MLHENNNDANNGTNSAVNQSTGNYSLEGTVFYFVGGGTVEMPYPPGYQLLYAHWVTQTSDSNAGPVYLNGIDDSSLVNKHVRVTGTTEVSVLHGPVPGYTYSLVNLTVQSIQIIP